MNEPQSKRRRVSPAEIKPSPSPSSVEDDGIPKEVLFHAPTANKKDTVHLSSDEIPALMLVELPKNNADDVLSALKRLEELLETEKNADIRQENRQEAVYLGLFVSLVMTLRKWPHQHDIQGLALVCLAALVYVGENVAHAVAKLGGIQCIVSAMKKFPNSPAINGAGLYALQNSLSWTSHEGVQAFLQCFVDGMDGIKLVLEAIKSFPDNIDIQIDGCGMLLTMSSLEKNRGALLEAGAVSVAATALERHLNSSEVKKRVRLFVNKVLEKN